MSKKNSKAKLIHFPPSIGCELAVWLLEAYRVPHIVNSQTAPFFLISIKLHGGSDYPFLEYEGQKLSSSLKVSNALEASVSPDRKLLPRDEKLNQEAQKFWTEYLSPKLAYATSRWAYYYLLPHRNLLVGPLTKGVPWWQGLVVKIAYRPIAWLIGKTLGITKAEPTKPLEVLEDVYDRIDKMLEDGRPYLYGDEPSLLDYGFAAMAAPTTLEANYGKGGVLPDIADVPEEMRKVVEQFRQRPAAALIARMYQEHR